MSGDDPRHGTVAGYNRIPCRDECCKRAMATYKARWSWDRHNGIERIVPTLGTRRRIQALNALGWSNQRIAAHAGMHPTNMTRLIYGDTMTRKLADRLAKTYDALSMRLPDGNRQAIVNVQNRARRNGWPPPLAWDDIENDPEPVTAEESDCLDEVVVDRVLSGDWHLPTTNAERAEVARRWVTGGRSTHALRKLTGWKVERYYRMEEVA